MREERGFALIAALWLLVALSVAGLQFSLEARTRRLAAANVVEGTQARAAAEAGLEHARGRLQLQLFQTQRLRGSVDPVLIADPWAQLEPLTPRSTTLDEVAYSVVMRDANAALHLNHASEGEIRRLLGALRIDHGDADGIAHAILDWRDADDFPRARGAERDFYLREGAPVLPRNGSFEGVGELLHVRGVTPEIMQRVRPYLTVQGSGQINLNTADPVVLAALPGIADEAITLILRIRSQGGRIGTLMEVADALSPGARALLQESLVELMGRTTTETREVEVWSEGRVEHSPTRAYYRALMVRAGSTVHMVSKGVG